MRADAEKAVKIASRAPSSGHALPQPYRVLMAHPQSPIIDFYPSGTNDSTHPLYHPWAVASPDTVGLGKDVMGGARHGVVRYHGLRSI